MARQNGSRFPDRVRFNWGFWDGVNDHRRGYVAVWRRGARDVHPDRLYRAGYYAGLEAGRDGFMDDSSAPAWATYQQAAR